MRANRSPAPAVLLRVTMPPTSQPPVPGKRPDNLGPGPGVALSRLPVARFVAAGLLMAVLLYMALFWQPVPTTIDPTDVGPMEPLVAVPEIDTQLLAQAKDSTREERLFLEAEPLSHLLAQSLNVSEDAGRALGIPHQMISHSELAADPARWRGRWLFYRGKVEELAGPRPGHPVPGYSIYEATLRLRDGSAVLFAFSKPPGEGVHVGGWARVDGYLMKLRDVAYPQDLQSVPLLVGPRLREDYEDWAPVKQLDHERLAAVIDTQRTGDQIEPSTDSWRTIDEDQATPLWHLGAFARDGDARTPEQWRQVPALNAQEAWDAFKKDRVERGMPMRILGMLASRRTIAARPNPAGIEEWTEAWLQVRDLGGKTIPVWVPKEVTVPLGTSLEVRGYYYRRLAYEGRQGKQYWTPLFVAADLDLFIWQSGRGAKEIGTIAILASIALIGLAMWSQRREAKRSAAAEDALVERRRRRRDKSVAAPNTP